MQLAERFFADEQGATAIEYGLIAALVCIAIIGAMTSLGSNLGNTWNKVGEKMPL